MKFFFFSVLSLCVFSAGTVQAQAPQLGCIDANTRLLSQEVKQHFMAQGFAVVRDAMVGMSPYQPFAAVVELAAAQNYRIVFVADKRAKYMDVEVINGAEKKIVHEEFKPKRDASRVIEFPFRQLNAGSYLFILKQHMRGPDACGAFTILRDTVNARKIAVKSF